MQEPEWTGTAGEVTFRTSSGMHFSAYAWEDGERQKFGARVSKFLLGSQTIEATLNFLTNESKPMIERAYMGENVPQKPHVYQVDLTKKTVVVYGPNFETVMEKCEDGMEYSYEVYDRQTLTYEEFAAWTNAE